ncbi:hypothetical protein ACFQH6_00755 [Halobacteriaceae archaeon GCM10025711]
MLAFRTVLVGRDPWLSRWFLQVAAALAVAFGFAYYAAVTWSGGVDLFGFDPFSVVLWLLLAAAFVAALLNAVVGGGVVASVANGVAPLVGLLAIAASDRPAAVAARSAAGGMEYGSFVVSLGVVAVLTGLLAHTLGVAIRLLTAELFPPGRGS